MQYRKWAFLESGFACCVAGCKNDSESGFEKLNLEKSIMKLT